MSFKKTLKQIPANEQEDIYTALTADGAVVVTDLFNLATIEQIRTDIEKALANEPWCNTANEGYGADFFGKTTKRLHGVLQYSPHIEECLMHPLALSTAQRWLNTRPHFSTAEVMAIGPGEQQQDLHTDAGSWRAAKLPGEILFSMTMALTEFTATNGATVVAPGSHLWPEDYTPVAEDFTAAEMSPGAVLFYSGNVLHSGGSNRTDDTRIGLYFGYIPFWLQPLENPAITHPDACLQALRPTTQTFLDYHPNGFKALLG